MTTRPTHRIEPDRRLSVAPMMDWTDRHERFLLRLISRRTLLYTEMIPTGALIHGDVRRFLAHAPEEAPVAAQLGGSDPADLATCARLVEEWGYAEVNLNVGCPSDRVVAGRFGACLMAEPGLVADCVAAMAEATTLPVTVKHRIGIDDNDSYEALCRFVESIAASGCRTFIVHARKAWLTGLSPKENRTIPPLRHDVVFALKCDFPGLEVILNGGIRDLDSAEAAMDHVDGVMIGRAAYETPWVLAEADARLFGEPPVARDRHAVLEAFLPYLAERMAEGVALHRVSPHLFGLFHGLPGARAWRRYITERQHDPEMADPEQALSMLREAAALVRAPLVAAA